uniref:Alpha 1,4-glycosyltransferase domain-containing protein n=1 Tax=Oryza punctata TaxID=4537 RepID=A0A0E0JI19_ORYPU
MTWLSPLTQFGRCELLMMESLFRSHYDTCVLIASDTMDSEGGSDKLRPHILPPDQHTGEGVGRHGAAVGTSAPAASPSGSTSPTSPCYIYKYGGVYLDTDVVAFTLFLNLRNAIGVQAMDASTGDCVNLQWTVPGVEGCGEVESMPEVDRRPEAEADLTELSP